MEAYQHIPLRDVKIADDFWSRYAKRVRETVIPYQWEALGDRIPDAEPSYAIHNFELAAGRKQGEFGGLVFQDSDLAKWLEAVGYSLCTHPDEALEKTADDLINLIVEAQGDDGYLNTYFTVKEPEKRWTNLYECHELYCAGHMMEAAVAYYRATGKRKLLDAMCRFADYIDTVIGPEEGKIHGYPGHQEIELALVKLHQVTGEARYLRLAQYFIDERGTERITETGELKSFFHEEWEKRGGISHWSRAWTNAPNLEYNQSHVPVREQSVAVGHSVRAVYMYSAMADLARLTEDSELLATCERLWKNITRKQMYVTGGIGSTHHGEAFSFDYDLPNDTVYAETCASIGLIFFAHRMLAIRPKSEYADVMERALYNLILASTAQDGRHYFYVNPLEVWPEASEKNPGKRHVKPLRQKWFGCSCCPPNIARLLASLGQYIYSTSLDTIFAHLYIGSQVQAEVANQNVLLVQESDLPWEGFVRISVSPEHPASFNLALRLPEWAQGQFHIRLNGQDLAKGGQGSGDSPFERDGYLIIGREWVAGDTVELEFPMDPQLIQAHPEVRADAGRVAIVRGPLVYCLEQADFDVPLSSVSLVGGTTLHSRKVHDLFGDAVVIETEGRSNVAEWNNEGLYRPYVSKTKPVRIRAIPYYLWGNRGIGEMTVWNRIVD